MTEIEYPKCPRCSRDIEDYEPDEDTGTARPIREPDRPAPSRHFVTAWPCGHRVKIEGLAFVVRAALAPCPHDSLTGDEGPARDLPGGIVVRWRCDACGSVHYDDKALAQLRALVT
jgi:hypothetical protein